MGKGRAGRKRKQNVVRVNGRISQRQADVAIRRQETEDEAKRVAREARIRIFGVTTAQVDNPDLGWVCGRLYMQDQISKGQLHAALRYEGAYLAFKRATAPLGGPARLKASQIGGVRGRASTMPDDVVDEAVDRYNAALKAIVSENSLISHRGNNLIAAAHLLVLDNQDLPHMYGDLRLALNALQHHFGVSDDDTVDRPSEAA